MILVENLTCLNALEGNIWKRISNQKIVMDESLVPNGVIDGKFVKNFVMDAKIDPKVEMEVSKLVVGTVCNPSIKICWKNLLMRMNRGC